MPKIVIRGREGRVPDATLVGSDMTDCRADAEILACCLCLKVGVLIIGCVESGYWSVDIDRVCNELRGEALASTHHGRRHRIRDFHPDHCLQ